MLRPVRRKVSQLPHASGHRRFGRQNHGQHRRQRGPHPALPRGAECFAVKANPRNAEQAARSGPSPIPKSSYSEDNSRCRDICHGQVGHDNGKVCETVGSMARKRRLPRRSPCFGFPLQQKARAISRRPFNANIVSLARRWTGIGSLLKTNRQTRSAGLSLNWRKRIAVQNPVVCMTMPTQQFHKRRAARDRFGKSWYFT